MSGPEETGDGEDTARPEPDGGRADGDEGDAGRRRDDDTGGGRRDGGKDGRRRSDRSGDGRSEVPPVEGADADALEELLDHFDELEADADDDTERERVQEARKQALEVATTPSVFGRVVYGFDVADATEVFLGAVLLGIPMLVEGGTLEVGEFLADRPLLLAATVAANVTLVVGILYVADIQDVRVRDRVFGLVPHRLIGVVVIPTLTAAALSTGWGRVDWAEPSVAFAQVVVTAVPMTIGGALGDILPGS